nr:hypothetical protein [Tanacetum cinerariifolium]
MERQVETELKLEEKFQKLCKEVSSVVEEKEDVRDLNKMARLQIMANESHLGVREKHAFVSNMNLGTLS